MDWKAKEGMDMLERIVALLLSLADLADRAGASPRDVRCRTLVFLNQAEAVAYGSLFDLAQAFGAPAVSQATIAPPRGGDSQADAALLALRLRALALVLTGVLTWLRRISGRQARAKPGSAIGRPVRTDMRAPHAWPPRRIDTS